MVQTVKATISSAGHVELNEAIKLKGKHRALVTILDEVEQSEIDKLNGL